MAVCAGCGIEVEMKLMRRGVRSGHGVGRSDIFKEILLINLLLAACANTPPPPDWQANANSALNRAAAAWLAGDSRAEAQEFERARNEIARTGRPDLLARAELMRCAAHVASLQFEPCTAFE